MNIKTRTLAAAAAVILSFGQPGLAADFTFKRIKPSDPGQGRLISIQVEPVEEEKPVLGHQVSLDGAVSTATARTGSAAGVSSTADWFWAEMSPLLSAGSSSRLSQAAAAIDRTPGKSAVLRPSKDRMQRIMNDYGAEILKNSVGTQVSPALVLAVIAVESNGKPGAVSSAGAGGLMQLMPQTAARFGVKDRMDPSQNIAGGVKYLAWLLEEFDGDPLLALAGYNAGEGAVRRAKGVPNYKETRNYVPKVVGAWQTARDLCLTRPSKATDGCIFAGLKVASR